VFGYKGLENEKVDARAKLAPEGPDVPRVERLGYGGRYGGRPMLTQIPREH